MKAFILIVGLILALGSSASADELTDSTVANSSVVKISSEFTRGSYYDWGVGNNGFGYCYHWASNGGVLNNGRPVDNYYCDQVRPSYYDWGVGNNGYTYCYRYTANRVVMNEGKPVDNWYCNNSGGPTDKPERSYHWKFEKTLDKRRCVRTEQNTAQFNEELPICDDKFMASIENSGKQRLALFCSTQLKALKLELDLSRETQQRDFEVIRQALENGSLSLNSTLIVDQKNKKEITHWQVDATAKTLTSDFVVESDFLKALEEGGSLKLTMVLSSSSFRKELKFSLKESRTTIRNLKKYCL